MAHTCDGRAGSASDDPFSFAALDLEADAVEEAYAEGLSAGAVQAYEDGWKFG